MCIASFGCLKGADAINMSRAPALWLLAGAFSRATCLWCLGLACVLLWVGHLLRQHGQGRFMAVEECVEGVYIMNVAV